MSEKDCFCKHTYGVNGPCASGLVPTNARDCEHGSLKRSCLVCELQQENAALKKALENDCVNHAETIRALGDRNTILSTTIANLHDVIREKDDTIIRALGEALEYIARFGDDASEEKAKEALTLVPKEPKI